MALIRNVTLYDLRMLYLLRRDNTDESLCVSLGLLELMDTLDSDEERTRVVEATLKMFSSLTYLVNNAPKADKEYFNNDGIDTTERRSRLKNAGQLRKSVEHTLSHLGWFDNLAVIYFLDQLIKSPRKYSLETLLSDLYELAGDSNSGGYTPKDTTSLLTTLAAKREELKRLNRLSQSLEASTKEEADSVVGEIERQIATVSAAIEEATENMETKVLSNIAGIRTKLSLEIEPLLRKVGTLQAQIELADSKLTSLQEELASSLTKLSERAKLDPKVSLVNMLTDIELTISRLNNQNEQDFENATAMLQTVLNRIKNSQEQLAQSTQNQSLTDVQRSKLFEMIAELNSLTRDIKDSTSVTQTTADELQELAKLVRIAQMETGIYKHNAIHNNSVVMKIKENING